MIKPKALVISGYGLNCEGETAFAFELAGAASEIVHINDLIEGEKNLRGYQLLAFPGGFCYGDDTGAGNAFANRIKNNLWEKISSFIAQDRLVISICNGFQIVANLGLVPAFSNHYGDRQIALTHNDSACYLDRWVDLEAKSTSPWLRRIKTLSLPIAHGEGKFFANSVVMKKLQQKKLVALKYCFDEICQYQNLKANPNGSLGSITAITDESGRMLGLMPHPERAIFFTQLPNWPLLKEQYTREGKKIPKFGPGLAIFKNAISYFK